MSSALKYIFDLYNLTNTACFDIPDMLESLVLSTWKEGGPVGRQRGNGYA
jgi:hypothetical protein